jgi:eukaryotic-like serine/threonine-protein kinase
LLLDARERGDRFAVANLTAYIMSVAQLAADEPHAAQQILQETMAEWSQQGFHVQHHNAVLGQVLIHLYLGRGQDAWNYNERRMPYYKSSLLLHLQQVKIDMLPSHARSAIAAATAAANPTPFLRAAERDARRLERENANWASAYARLIRAGLAAFGRDAVAARGLLGEAALAFDNVDMNLCAAATRRRLGILIGGEEGRGMVRRADDWMTAQTIKNPARMAATIAPGFPD